MHPEHRSQQSDTRTDSTADRVGGHDPRLANLQAMEPRPRRPARCCRPTAVLALASDFAITITSTFPEGPRAPPRPPRRPLRRAHRVAVAVFLSLAAVDHLLTATVARRTYEDDLRRGINRFRWVEYSLSATLMVLLIASYSGITDITAVIAIAGANVAMILFGWQQERSNPPGRPATTMVPFWFGTIVGIAPWIAITVNLIGAAEVPGFVYGIFVAQLVFFFSFGAQPVAAVPRDRPLVRLRLRREDLPRPQPGRQIGTGLADLRRIAHDLDPGTGDGGATSPPSPTPQAPWSASPPRAPRRTRSNNGPSSPHRPPGEPAPSQRPRQPDSRRRPRLERASSTADNAEAPRRRYGARGSGRAVRAPAPRLHECYRVEPRGTTMRLAAT